jgi:FkbM family methyltransferase
MRVFLDVGAHNGETLAVVRDPRWRFDRIFCFEPAPQCWPALEALADERVCLCRFGLSSQDETLYLRDAGSVGASTAEKAQRSDAGELACEFRDAAAWFKDNLQDTDEIFAKINVEGAEAEILPRLATTGALSFIDHLLIHFDVRKVPSLRHVEPELHGLLADAKVEYFSADQIAFGGVYRGTRNWLSWCADDSWARDWRYRRFRKLEHRIRLRLYPLKRIGLPRGTSRRFN